MTKVEAFLLFLIILTNLLWLNDARVKYDKIERLDIVLSRLLHNLGFKRLGDD